MTFYSPYLTSSLRSLPPSLFNLIKRRSYRNFNLASLLHDLDSVDRDLFDSFSNVDSKVNFLSDSLIHVYNLQAPLRVFTPKKPHSPWMTSAIKSLITARNNARRSSKRGGGVTALARYKSLRNSVQKEIRNARYNFYKDKLNSCVDSREMWKIINQLGITNSATCQQMPEDPNSFNRHFIGSSNPNIHYDSRPLASISPDRQFYFKHVEISDVLEALASVHSNALGSDEIPLRHLKVCLPTILGSLLNIFDLSLQSGHFPSEWKKP